MLVLARKRNERIRIGRDVEVVVVSIRGDKVRLGIAAPPDVVVDREEVSVQRRRRPRPSTTTELGWPPPRAGFEPKAAGVAVDAAEVRHGA